MNCCISGCTRETLHRSYRFCSQHWTEYKDIVKSGQMPEWLRFLIKSNRNEEYHNRKRAEREVSLEALQERAVHDEWLADGNWS